MCAECQKAGGYELNLYVQRIGVNTTAYQRGTWRDGAWHDVHFLSGMSFVPPLKDN